MTVSPTVVYGRSTDPTLNLNSVGAVPAAAGTAGVTVSETGEGATRQTILTFTNVNIPITRNGTTDVFGSLEVYDFPTGVVNVQGAVASSLSVTRGETTNMTATAPLVVSAGTVAAANDATLTSTEANILPSTACTLVAGTKTIGALLAAPVTINGSTNNTGPAKVFLNVAGDNSASQCAATGNSSVNVSGKIVITWAPHGDFS